MTQNLSEALANRQYLPVLSVRPAEMKALEALPERDKDLMLPLILLRPWATSNELRSTFNKVRDAYGRRSWIADFDPFYPRPQGIENPRQVFEELDFLKASDNGYENWCSFVEGEEDIIPCIQLGVRSEFRQQLLRLKELGRGYVIRLPKAVFAQIGTILAEMSEASDDPSLIVLDYGQASISDLASAAQCVSLVEKVRASLPKCRVAVSATSFPDSFSGRSEESIRERGFFNTVQKHLPKLDLIYSDRGSAREERRTGGGGAPIPRIDYPLWDSWRFYRQDAEDGYELAAQELLSDPKVWNPDIRIWGTQMIERTAAGDRYAIISPVRATAVRINLHLHRQIFYSDRHQLTKETDDAWVD